jgi:alpha-mannosidase
VNIRLNVTLFLASVVLLAIGPRLSAAAVQSGPSSIFRVGTFNRSSTEFAAGRPAKPVNFIIGKSSPAKDWYAVQPALAISPGGAQAANGAAAPRAVSFSLESPPAASYQLAISLLIESPSVPALKISINGKEGTFYLHPKLDYNVGDELSWYDPTYSHADLRFSFPGSYLRHGANTITFQVVEEAGEEVPNASLTYDAIELDRGGEGSHAERSSAQIIPTIFYRRNSSQANQLEERVDVFLQYDGPIQAGSGVDLVLAGKRYHQALHGHQDFGEEKIDFSIPEFPPQTRAQVTWDVDGYPQRSEQLIDPKKKWNLFLVPHIHIDVGYSDYQAKVAAIQSRVIDEAMELTAKHPDFRFSVDGSWALAQFMKTRTSADQERAITAMRNQQLFIPAQYASLLTGFPTAETLIRSLYPSAGFSRVHGTPFNYANITDVPTYTWSYASILASAGIKYFLAGSDNGRGGVFAVPGRLNESSPFWWEGPDGKKVLFWYSRHYMQMQLLFGLPPLLSAGVETLPLFLQQYEQPTYRADAAIIYGTQVENTDLFPQQAELAEQWNSVYAYPRLQYSGFYDSLKSIADQFGNEIPTIRGDGGPYWEDGIAADAYYSAMERENESRGPSAEKLATLTALVDPRLAPDKPSLDRMWTDMVLMDEHTWASYNSVSSPKSMEAVKQLAVKDSNAVNAHALVDWLARNSMTSIVNSISASKGSLIVFNPLNWERSGLVSIDLKEAMKSQTHRPIKLYQLNAYPRTAAFLRERALSPQTAASVFTACVSSPGIFRRSATRFFCSAMRIRKQ